MPTKRSILYISSKSWNDIKHQLDKKQKQHDIIENEKKLKETKRRLNEEMTKSWLDSKQNISLKKEREHFQRLEKIKQDRIEQFYRLREEQKQKREEFVANVKKQQLLSTDYPKQLNGALILSACLYEREKQIELKEIIKQENKKINNELDQKMVKAIDGRPDNTKQEMYEKRAKFDEHLRQEIAKHKNDEDSENKRRINQESMDNQRINDELEALKNQEIENKRKLKLFQKKQYDNIFKLNKQLKQQQIEENQQIDTIIDIYRTTKDRIDCLRKAQERELIRNMEKRQDYITQKFAKLLQTKKDDETKRLQKQQDELYEKSEQQHLAKLKKLAELKQQRINDHQEYLERIKQQQQIDNELKKWEMLNRFKNNENEHDVNQKKLQEIFEKKQCYRQQLLEQIDADKETKQKELELNRSTPYIDDEDDKEQKLSEYADQVLEFAKKNNFPTYPIEKVIRIHKNK